MPLIQITPDLIRSQAVNVRKYKVNHESTMTQLRQLVMSLNSGWKGAAQDAFVAKFQSMDFAYKKFATVLDDYAKLLDKAANDLQNTDQNLKNIIQNIG